MADLLVLPPESPFREWRWTVHELDRAIESGVVRDPEAWELIRGRLLRKMSKGTLHFYVFRRLLTLLQSVYDEGWIVRPEGPLQASDDTQPEPDISVVPGRDEDYLEAHPRAVDARMIVEVSVNSISDDLGWKRDVYAASGVPEYWVVDAEGRRLIVHRQPLPAGFAETFEIGPDGTIPGTDRPLSDILPPPDAL